MADEKTKLPRSSFEELCKIITAYGHQKSPVSPKEVATTAAMSETIVSANNKFLMDIGILEGGRKKQATTRGKKLAQALDLNMPNELRSHWREIIRSSNFLSKILAAVRIRKGMDESTLQSHIAYSAGEPNKGFVMTGARAVIDLLRAAELVREEDGKLTAVDVQMIDASEEQSDGDSFALLPSTSGSPIDLEKRGSLHQVLSRDISANSGVQLRINVNLQCTPSDLDGLGARLREIIEEIKKKTSEEPNLSDKGDE